MRIAVVELTNRCNLSCQHCLSGRHGGSRVLSLGILRKVLDDAKALGFNSLSFTGGDPTLHPKFREVIRMTANAGYRFRLVTNGWNFPAIYSAIVEHREALAGITFSLDGATEETHDSLRGGGSFRRVLRGFTICVIEELPFTVNMVLTSRNQCEVVEMVRLATQLGSSGVRFGHLMPTPVTAATHLDLTPEDKRTVEHEIQGLREQTPIAVVIAPGHHTSDLFPCSPLRGEELNVDCDGNLTKCCQLSNHGGNVGRGDVIGSLHEMSFSDAWQLLVQENARFREEKNRRLKEKELLESDLFSCWYCSLYYEKIDWLRQVPNHPWSRLMWPCSNRQRLEVSPQFVSLSAAPEKVDD